MPYDVVTFGEAMIRLSPPDFRRLEQARGLDLFVGGAELNTAAALVRLGTRATWVSRLTDNPLGRLVARHAREAGVDTEHLIWTGDGRVGLYFVEFGAAPRASGVIYDRKGSAAAGIRPGLVPWAELLAGARWFHVTGITPALSPTAAEATREALSSARAAGLTISIDLNYRAKLWSAEEARRWMTSFLDTCDVLITTEEDAARVLGVSGTDEQVASELARRFPLKAVAVTLRDNPLVWRNRWTAVGYQGGKVFHTRAFEVEIVDRLGAGDCFAAGLIHGLLAGDLQRGLDWGVAAGALKHTHPGDFACFTLEEVEALLAGGELRIRR